MRIMTKRPIPIYDPTTGEICVYIPKNVPLMNGFEEHFHLWEEFFSEYSKETPEISYDPEFCGEDCNSALEKLYEAHPDIFSDYEAIGISNLANFELA